MLVHKIAAQSWTAERNVALEVRNAFGKENVAKVCEFLILFCKFVHLSDWMCMWERISMSVFIAIATHCIIYILLFMFCVCVSVGFLQLTLSFSPFAGARKQCWSLRACHFTSPQNWNNNNNNHNDSSHNGLKPTAVIFIAVPRSHRESWSHGCRLSYLENNTGKCMLMKRRKRTGSDATVEYNEYNREE